MVSAHALGKISEAIQGAENLCEVGGVLLGHRRFFTYFVVNVTVPPAGQAQSNISFVLNGQLETESAAALASEYAQPPKLVGIWHSHVGGMETFSAQDRQSNKIFAGLMGGAISALALPDLDARLGELAVYYVSPGGKEERCPVFPEGRRPVPLRYLRKKTKYPEQP